MRRVSSKIFIWVCLGILILPGCSEPPAEPKPKPVKYETTLHIGLIPEHNLFKQLERYSPMASYLAKKIQANIELKILTRYGNIIENFSSMHLDAAFFGSFTYTLARAKLGIQVIARPENLSGVSSYHGLIFVRKDSGIKSAKDMEGKIFAFVDRATTAGHLLPMAFFKKNGIENYTTFLKESYFTGTHEDAIYDVLNKKADIGAAKNTVYSRLSASNDRIKDELVILQKSPDVPENGLAVRKDLDPSIIIKLKQSLLNMHTDSEGSKILEDFGAKRFIETTDKDYESVYQYAQQIGLNLETYDYIND